MHATDVILAKRTGAAHDRATLDAFLGAYGRGEVPDYQVAAWLMAVCWRGMTPQETADLTDVMARSGDALELAGLPHTVDKHSTGGVGDKTSLALAPLLATRGATVAKMSGRGLGHTGGTVDKLESIPGFRAELSDDAFLRQAHEVGVALTGQSKDLAPLDGLLYALRDATGTVESLPLIASSIMSKKLAGGAQSIVLDVKVGRGAFLKSEEEARALAEAMLDIGRRAGRRMRALLTDMSQPLGLAIGNALEVREAIDCLRGEGPADLRELVLALASELLDAAGLDGGRAGLEHALDRGAAFDRFVAWIEAQGGDVAAFEGRPPAPGEAVLESPASGVVVSLDALAVGRAVKVLGGGRGRKGDAIDADVGALLHAKVGDRVEAGAPLATLRHRDGRGLEEARALVRGAYRLGERVATPPLVVAALR